MMQNQHEIERVGTSAQRAQSEMLKALDRTFKQMMLNLAKSFGKGKDATIEIKVDGKTKLKGQVKDGVFTASKNELSADEIKSLKAYFASLPNPALKSKDFEVLVDDKTILKTENGAVVSQATPERTVEAQQAFEAVQAPSSVSPTETPSQSPSPQSTAEPSQSQPQSPQPEPSKATVPSTPEPETKTIPGLDADLHVPQSADQNRNNRDLLEKAKCSLALLSDRPPGEREWIGKDYALIEGLDGSFRVTHQSRGEILNFANGKVTGQATAQDVAKLNDLLTIAKQTHIPQQKPNQKKALAVGGVKA
jgi:hypothetical protein